MNLCWGGGVQFSSSQERVSACASAWARYPLGSAKAQYHLVLLMSFSGGYTSAISACSAGDLGSIPGLGRSPGEGHGSPLQFYCLKNPMDRGVWWTTVYGLQRVRYDRATNTHNDLLKLTKFHSHLCHQLYPDVGKI